MTRTVVIEPEADEDLARAFAWYEQTSPGMGYAFVDAMREAVARLTETLTAARRGPGRRAATSYAACSRGGSPTQ